MSLLPFPADSAEYEEYVSVMETMANEAETSTPDPKPKNNPQEDEEYNFYRSGPCEDAPCCGCCGQDSYDSYDY